MSSKTGDFVRDGRLTIVNKAIAVRPGPVTFFVNNSLSEWGTINPTWRERNLTLYDADSREITVEATTFELILREHGVPYYLKIDIEGADLLCVRALKSSSERPKFLSIESSTRTFDEVLEEFKALRALGYGRYKIVPQHKIHLTKPHFPSREGKFVAHNFEEGATGLFGDDIPGEWINQGQALRRYTAIHRRLRLLGDRTHRSEFCVLSGVGSVLRLDGMTHMRCCRRTNSDQTPGYGAQLT